MFFSLRVLMRKTPGHPSKKVRIIYATSTTNLSASQHNNQPLCSLLSSEQQSRTHAMIKNFAFPRQYFCTPYTIDSI